MGTQSRNAIKSLAAVATVTTSWTAALADEQSPFGAFADADLRQAWAESAAGFTTPSFADYVAARATAFRARVPDLFVAGPVLVKTGERVLGGGPAAGHHFGEIKASGGTERRAEVAGFYGAEVEFFDAAVSYADSENRSGDGRYENGLARAGAEAAFSDQAGTTVGFGGTYVGKSSRVASGHNTSPDAGGDNVGRSGEGDVFFRSTLGAEAKFATRVAATFTDGDFAPVPTADNVLAADSSYDFFWLGENLARGTFALSQENFKYGAAQRGYLTGRVTLENDFPIADRLYLSGGFAAFGIRRNTSEYRLFPRARMLWRVTNRWGVFMHYRPELRVPDFRDLYLGHGYVVPTVYRPLEDNFVSLRGGATYNFLDLARVTGAAYENRFHETYAPRDVAAGRAAYVDVGPARTRGAEITYRLSWRRWEHYGGAAYTVAHLINRPAGHFPYLPDYSGCAGMTLVFTDGYKISLEVLYLGERYATPAAAAPLAPAWVPAVSTAMALHAGISLTAALENFTDAIYYEPGGVAAPRRAFRAGIDLVF